MHARDLVEICHVLQSGLGPCTMNLINMCQSIVFYLDFFLSFLRKSRKTDITLMTQHKNDNKNGIANHELPDLQSVNQVKSIQGSHG